MGVWSIAQTAEGKIYYYHQETKKTTWTKPEGYDGPAAPAAAATPAGPAGSAADWVEANAEDGRTYYYNKITRATVWELPEVLRKQQQQRPPQNGRSEFVAGGGRDDFGAGYNHDRRMERRDDRGHGLPQKPSFDGPRGGGGVPWESRRDDGTGFRGPMPAKTDEPEYGTPEAAEEAFFKLLKRNNISPDTDWEKALKSVIRDREYRAIKDPKERKQAYEKYCQEVRAQEKGKEKERKERLREDFRKMLTTHEDILHYSRWKTARPLIEREAVFKSAGDEDERRRMFDEYILELKKQHIRNEFERREIATHELDGMLKVLVVDPDTSWTDAQDIVMNNERYVSEDIFRSLNELDVFGAFENHMKALDRVANEATQKDKQLKRRRQRQARDGFKQVLNEQLRGGSIKPGTKWKDIRPLIADDPGYTAYVGMQGSDPLELFWDIVEDEERKLRSKRNDALDVLEEVRFEMILSTTMEQFVGVMRSHPKTSSLRDDELSMIYDRLMEKIRRRDAENKQDAERHKNKIEDAVRSAIKKIEPPIRLEDTYDEVARLLAGQRDFEAADEDVRRNAYDRHMRRLKERGDHDRVRRDRERERERERDYRNGSRRDERDRERRHPTRTPEMDVYEGDRRKAQEAREKQYRKASFGPTPPPRDRVADRYERRNDRHDGMSVYDRERREREMERERNFMSRADPRDKGRTLDYGDEDAVGSRPGSVRKRRDSDTSSRQDPKRARRERRTRSPEPDGLLKEEPPALQSGSEEGEIEEV